LAEVFLSRYRSPDLILILKKVRRFRFPVRASKRPEIGKLICGELKIIRIVNAREIEQSPSDWETKRKLWVALVGNVRVWRLGAGWTIFDR
jgi:hypothetical protein